MNEMERRDGRVWLGLLLLVVGLTLADRSFALWRNDARNFAHWDGSHLTDAQLTRLGMPIDPKERAWQGHRTLELMGFSGLGCVAVACGLLWAGLPAGRAGQATADA